MGLNPTEQKRPASSNSVLRDLTSSHGNDDHLRRRRLAESDQPTGNKIELPNGLEILPSLPTATHYYISQLDITI